MRNLLFIAVLLLTTCLIHGQQLPQYSQFMWHQYAYNAAYAGMDRSLSVSALMRTQWVEFDNSPQTQVVYGHLPLYFLEGSAGFRIVNEQLGASQRLQMDASYNYVRVINGLLFSVGMRAGIQQMSLNSSLLRTPSGRYLDGLIFHNDPLLDASLNIIQPTLSLGSYVRWEGLEAGLSVENFAAFKINNTDFSYTSRGHIHFFTQYYYALTEDIKLVPAMLFKSDGAGRSQLDIGARATYRLSEVGIFFRDPAKLNSLNILGGTRVSDKISVYYSFDVGLNSFADFHQGSHELSITYNLSKPIKTGELPKIIYNPRFN